MVIFINGSINSGKTTIANLLKTKIPDCAHVEIDDLHSMIDWMPLTPSIPINLVNAASLINNFIHRKLNCIVTYPLGKDDYKIITKDLVGDDKLFFVTLNPKLDVALSNRGRELTGWEKERIKYHYETGINNPGFGIIIDNSNQTPEETVEMILSKINEK